MPLIDTILDDTRWEGLDLETLAEAAARATLSDLGLPPDDFAIALLACDDARIATLNADFRGKPQPTNILSFPSEERGAATPGVIPDLPDGDPDDPAELGDLAIAWETCAQEAADQSKALADHVTHLIVHGALHLLGFDHIDDRDADVMETTEARILARLGVADPY